MARYMKGNMWSVFNKVDTFIITTNAIVKTNGALVMGAGIAKQARDSFPGLDKTLGNAIRIVGRDYGFICGGKIGIFQVKYHYKDDAELSLIARSAKELDTYSRQHPDKLFAINFPGIGNGKLSYDEVFPLIDMLPNNVQVWTFN